MRKRQTPLPWQHQGNLTRYFLIHFCFINKQTFSRGFKASLFFYILNVTRQRIWPLYIQSSRKTETDKMNRKSFDNFSVNSFAKNPGALPVSSEGDENPKTYCI